MTSTQIRIGYVPLNDAAPILAAEALGLFARHGLAATLVPCASWAALRDRIAFGLLDAAQMLSPMPIAAALVMGGVGAELRVGATLGRNGNTITFGHRLVGEIIAATGSFPFPLPASALAAALAARRKAGSPAPVIAVVFPYSSHNYLLRHWLAEAGIDPDEDLHLVVAPPPRVAEMLASREIDGFCAGEPWGSRAVDLRVGRIALTTGDIWPGHPEKVLAFATSCPDGMAVAAIAAVIEAGRWIDDPANHRDAAEMLHDAAMPGVPALLIAAGLAGRISLAADEAPSRVPAPRFFADDASYPDPAHGAWWRDAMRRWGHAPEMASTHDDPVARLWRPDLWHQAIARLGAVPAFPAFSPADQECPT